MSRARRRASLRTRLVVSSVALIAVVCAVIGTVTTLALQSFLFTQLDKQVVPVAARARLDPGYDGKQPVGPPVPGTGSLRFITGPGLAPGTVGGENRRGGAAGGLGGGLPGGSQVADATKEALLEGADAYTWVATAIGSQNAAGYQLATGKPVMVVGGFNGSDPSPTPERFKEFVAAGKIHYFIASGGMGRGGGSGTSSQISSWVEENFGSTTLGGTTVYDLTDPS